MGGRDVLRSHIVVISFSFRHIVVICFSFRSRGIVIVTGEKSWTGHFGAFRFRWILRIALERKGKVVCYEIAAINSAFITTLGAALLNPMAKG